MTDERFGLNHIDADALDAAGRSDEVFVDQFPTEPDGFEDLRAAVALHRGNAHLAGDF